MCGIAALQLRNPSLHPQTGQSPVLHDVPDRGPRTGLLRPRRLRHSGPRLPGPVPYPHGDGISRHRRRLPPTGADVAKAMALGADAIAIGTAALIALGTTTHATPQNTLPWDRRQASTTSRTDATRRHHHPGPETRLPAGPGRRRAAPGQLPARPDHGSPDHRSGLRKIPPAQPRT